VSIIIPVEQKNVESTENISIYVLQ